MATDATFTGSIPYHYDRGLGPNIFEFYAADIAARAAANKPKRLLELAAGTGIVTRRLCETIHEYCDVTAIDLSPAMLDIAKDKVGGSNVRFQTADAMELPFDTNSFDQIVCQFGVMFFPDKLTAAKEALRVLKPGGRYLFNVWDSWDHNSFAKTANDTIAGFFDGDPPGFYQLPFGYHDVEEIGHTLANAGIEAIESGILPRQQTVENPEEFTEALVRGNPVADEIADRGGSPEQAIAAVRKAFAQDDGSPLVLNLQAIVFLATKPL